MTTERRGWLNGDPRWSVLENESDGARDGEAMADDGSGDCLDPLLLAAARELRRPVTLDATLDARIMAAVEAEGAPGEQVSGFTAEWGVATMPVTTPSAASAPAQPARGAGAGRRRVAALWSWLREPRTLQLSPLGGLLGLGGLATAALVAVVAVRDGGNGPLANAPATVATGVPASVAPPAAPTTPAALPDVQVVQFVLVAPGARSVALVGDFNDWDSGATPLRAAGGGRRVWSVEVPLEPGRHRYAFVVDGEEWVADPAAPPAPGADFGEPSSVVTVANQRS